MYIVVHICNIEIIFKCFALILLSILLQSPLYRRVVLHDREETQ